MSEDNDTWNEYGKLVLKELERLNESQEKMRSDMDEKFSKLTSKISEMKNVEKDVTSHNEWKNSVNDVWSVSQMKEAKDEIYNQKNRWIAAIAILGFIQVIFGIALTIWAKLQ